VAEKARGESHGESAFGYLCSVSGTASLVDDVVGARRPAFQRLTPLLIDIDGWQGKKPDGMSMDMPNGSMTTATREYDKGPARLHASVVVGQMAIGALTPLVTGMNVNTSEGHMLTDTLHGMKVLKSYTTAQKSGALLVALDKDAMFSLSYNGMSEDEALALAEKFDWKAIQAATKTK
jgi:hypothetical protein